MIFPVACEEYKGVTWMCRDEIKKAKAQSEVNLARDAKNKNKCFYMCISKKRKTKVSVPTLINKMEELGTTDVEKAEILNKFLSQSSLSVTLPTTLKSVKSLNLKEGAGGTVPFTTRIEQF